MPVASQVRVPADQSMLTSEWLREALREGGVSTPEITSLDIKEIGVGRGYVCLSLRLTPHYAGPRGEAPRSLVAKIPGFVAMPDEDSRLLVEELRAAEVHWYRDLSKDCPVRVPHSYWGGVDTSNAATAVLLEDLGDLRATDQSIGLTPDELALAVDALAKVHARWWEQPRVRELPWLRGPEYTGALWQKRFADGWPAARRTLGDALPAAFTPIGDGICNRMAGLFCEAAASASTLVHGDYRAENLLFAPAGSRDEICILDWQIAQWGSGLGDLGYLLGQSVLPEQRARTEHDLVRRYYEGLRSGGVSGYSLKDCELDYRRGLLTSTMIAFQAFGLLDQMIADGPGDVDAEGRDLWQKWIDSAVALIAMIAERSAIAAVENDAGSVL